MKYFVTGEIGCSGEGRNVSGSLLSAFGIVLNGPNALLRVVR
jgi:hypothetical protein